MKDGVYLGLAHEAYLAVPERRGSTDFTKLYSKGRGWWWTSRYNPHHVDKSTTATVFGNAWHALHFEGRAAYESRFAVEPNPREYRDLLTSATDLYSALKAKGAPGLKAKMAKNDLVQMGKAYLEGANIWDDIIERWERTLKGRTPLSSAEAYSLEAIFATAEADKETRVLCGMDEEVRLAEVSVLWTPSDGVPRRFRMDSLLPTATVDGKSFADWRGKSDPAWVIGDIIARENYDVQLAMAHEARRAAYAMIEAGQIVHCGSNSVDAKREINWLKRFPAEAPRWCWAWLFYQKAEGGQAPELIPVRVGFGDDVHRSGWRKYQIGLATYLENVKAFGLEKPWTGVSRLYDTSDRYQRRVIIPSHGHEQQAQPGEEEAVSWTTNQASE